MGSLFAVKKVLLLHAKSPKESVFKAEITAGIILLIFVEGKYLSSVCSLTTRIYPCIS
jgi:hypothetical protein